MTYASHSPEQASSFWAKADTISMAEVPTSNKSSILIYFMPYLLNIFQITSLTMVQATLWMHLTNNLISYLLKKQREL